MQKNKKIISGSTLFLKFKMAQSPVGSEQNEMEGVWYFDPRFASLIEPNTRRFGLSSFIERGLDWVRLVKELNDEPRLEQFANGLVHLGQQNN